MDNCYRLMHPNWTNWVFFWKFALKSTQFNISGVFAEKLYTEGSQNHIREKFKITKSVWYIPIQLKINTPQELRGFGGRWFGEGYVPLDCPSLALSLSMSIFSFVSQDGLNQGRVTSHIERKIGVIFEGISLWSRSKIYDLFHKQLKFQMVILSELNCNPGATHVQSQIWCSYMDLQIGP